MIDETEAPERIWMSPKDAALFAQKYGHPNITQPTVGDPCVSYVLFTEPSTKDKRIEELEARAFGLEAELNAALGQLLIARATIAELKGKTQ